MSKLLVFFRYLAIWSVSTATALLGMLPPAVLGLVVPGQVVLPLAMCVGAIFAAVTANFVGNRLFPPDRSRSSLLYVVGVTEAAAVAVAVTLLVLLFTLGGPPTALIFILIVCAGVVALNATVAARLLRTTEVHPRREGRVAVGLVVLGLLAVVVVPPAACYAVVSCGP